MTTPIVLVHGGWCTAASWQRVVSILSPRGYTCFAPTLPAHEATTDQPLRVRGKGLREYRASLLAEISAQSFAQPPVIIGHSMGAILAQQLAADIQPLALVLLAPLEPAGLAHCSAMRSGALAPWLGAALRGCAYKPGFEQASRILFNSVGSERRRSLHESLVHESARVALQLGFWSGSRVSTATEKGSCPVYLVSAGRDRLAPASAARRLAQRYSGAALRHYPERGHWLVDDEETEEMMHGICSWLRPLEQRFAQQQRR